MISLLYHLYLLYKSCGPDRANQSPTPYFQIDGDKKIRKQPTLLTVDCKIIEVYNILPPLSVLAAYLYTVV